jgi:hypothetical protein
MDLMDRVSKGKKKKIKTAFTYTAKKKMFI